MSFAYLGSIVFALLGLTVADWRYRLVLFFDFKRAARTLMIGLVVFLLWDLLGIAKGIFFNGDSRYDTGVIILPEVPIEELFFLLLLCYLSLILWRILEKR